VTITVIARRFRCDAAAGPGKVFTDRMPGVAAAYARRTARLAEILRHIGLVLRGAAGTRLAQRLALPVSGSTLLRLVRRGMPTCVGPAPRIVRINDWAWRPGHRYGSIVCDLQRRRIVNLLPELAAGTVQARLAAHPGIEVIACDRGGAHGSAALRACPDAQQVADRWHLFENRSAAFPDAVRRSLPCIRGAIGTAAADPRPLTAAERRQHDGLLRRQAGHADIHRLAEAGTRIKQLVCRTGRRRRLLPSSVPRY
jgi:transposase